MLQLFGSRSAVGATALVLAACGQSQPTTEPKLKLSAAQIVSASAVPATKLGDHFRRVATVPNPCGSFASRLTFGIDSDRIEVSCTPDTRTSVSDGFNGQIDAISAPANAPWRTVFDATTGRELARLSEFTTCSSELDLFEKTLGGESVFFRCKSERSESSGWRLITRGQDGAPLHLFIPPTSGYNYFWSNSILVRQPTTGVAGPIPFPEAAIPKRELDWMPWLLSGAKDACGTIVDISPDHLNLVAIIGRVSSEEHAGGMISRNCVDHRHAFVRPVRDEKSTTGIITDNIAASSALVVESYRDSWNTSAPIANVVSHDGVASMSIIPGDGFAPWRYSGVAALRGRDLIAIEVAPRMRMGDRPFLYVLFDWDGKPLARFFAARVSMADDRSRIAVVFGKSVEVWDLK